MALRHNGLMPGTFSHILLHIIFSTKGREPLITPDLQSRLYEFIGGIVRSEKGTLLAIGGMPDHVHLLVRWNTERPVGDLVRNVKARSSLWVHKTFADRSAYAWQSGYGVFSVSDSRAEAVRRYIAQQAAHHAGRSFREEFEIFLREHNIDFEPSWLD